jgi:hypothetical protein
MNSKIHARKAVLKRTLFTTLSLFGSGAILMAQGYVYTFVGFPGFQQLDGSYVILSNIVPGAPTLADLLEVKIVDAYGAGAVFEVSVSAQGFNVTSFDAQGFNGTISGMSQSEMTSRAGQRASASSAARPLGAVSTS